MIRNPANAKDGLTTDPGWHNASYSSTAEYLRVDLGSAKTVSRVSYIPRVMAGTNVDGSWNGVFRQYEIYVTDDASGTIANWGAPVASGEWTWPSLQQRRDVSFTAKTGRYVYFRRVTAYGWYTEQGYPGFANANEIWVYEQSQGGGSGGWNQTGETRYLYDGMNVVQERDGANTPTVTYTRGKDLSGSLEGAGGIGGLLARSHGYSGGNWSTHNFYHADGNGNVTYIVNSSQAMVASYKYDPYGRTISASGTLAGDNVYRFSSKAVHLNSGVYYYGYRLYDPVTQRWLNRDPLTDDSVFRRRVAGVSHREAELARKEALGNAYYFVHNRPSIGVDTDGLCLWGGIFRPVWEGFKLNPLHPLDGMFGNCAAAMGGAAAIILGNDLEDWTGSPWGLPTANDDDRLQHCVTSCKLARACGASTAAALGYIKELKDRQFGGSKQASAGDLAANQHGRNGACDSRSCEDYCAATRDQYPPPDYGN